MKRPRDFKIPPGSKVLGINVPGPAAAPARSKYRAVRTEHAGVVYASRSEAAHAARLDADAASGAVLWWIGQPKFRLGCPENVYVADFLVVAPGGVHVVDVKGMETAKFRRDKKLWSAYGPCDLHIVKGGKVVEVVEGGRREGARP